MIQVVGLFFFMIQKKENTIAYMKLFETNQVTDQLDQDQSGDGSVIERDQSGGTNHDQSGDGSMIDD